jgi:hypothetical protein
MVGRSSIIYLDYQVSQRRFIAGLILLMVVSGPAVFADFNDLYGEITGAFGGFEDPNTGLTVFPTLLIPMGGRYEGMGTAYTALAWDTGFLEANPAGSSVLETSELSFLHHNWIADSRLEGVVYTFRIDDLGIGVGGKFLYLPFTEYGDWGERESGGLISETIATFNVSYNLFSSYDFYGLAVGTNLKVAYRHIPAIIYPGQSAITGMLDVGVLSRFNALKFYHSRTKNLSMGAVIKNLGPKAGKEPLPTLVTAGIGYAPARPITIAVDYNRPISLDGSVPPERWYIASGIDVAVTPFLSIQSGFRLKENPHVSVGASLELEKVSFTTNYNLDLSGSVNPVDKFSVEARLNLGDSGRGNVARRLDELYAAGLEAFAKGKYEQAIRDWEEALRLDPEFRPAREGLETALKRLELQERIKAGQTAQ